MEGDKGAEYSSMRVCSDCVQREDLCVWRVRRKGQTEFNIGLQSGGEQVDSAVNKAGVSVVERSSSIRQREHLHTGRRVVIGIQPGGVQVQHRVAQTHRLPEDEQGP